MDKRSLQKKDKPELRVAVNGFGRIGKAVSRIILSRVHANLELVAINDHNDIQSIAESFELDTSYGWFEKAVRVRGKKLLVGKKSVNTYSKDDPASLPWRKEKIDVVVESTGAFTKVPQAKRHIKAGAKQVILSAYPSAGKARVVVAGASDLTKTNQALLSHASCTTTCVSPVMRVLEEKFSIEVSSLLAVESVTHSSQTVDKTRGRGRRRRSAMINMIPIQVEAHDAVPEVVPALRRNFVAQGVRVPTPVVHLAFLNVVFNNKVTAAKINKVFIEAARSPALAGIINVTDKPLVSQDLRHRSESAIVDLSMTRVAGRLAQIFAWYDNEWAFSNRIVDLLEKIDNNRVA